MSSARWAPIAILSAAPRVWPAGLPGCSQAGACVKAELSQRRMRMQGALLFLLLLVLLWVPLLVFSSGNPTYQVLRCRPRCPAGRPGVALPRVRVSTRCLASVALQRPPDSSAAGLRTWPSTAADLVEP